MITVNLRQITRTLVALMYLVLTHYSIVFISGRITHFYQGVVIIAWAMLTFILLFVIISTIDDIFDGTIEKEWKINLPKFTKNTEKDELMEAYGKALMSGNQGIAERIFQQLVDKKYL